MMKKTSPAGRSSLLPVLIDLREKHVVLLSDADSCEDAVSVLKALIPCTDHLSVLMTSCGSELKQMAKVHSFVLREKPYEREDLYDADVVICTLSSRDMINEVYAAARTLGIRLCILSDPARSDFLLDPERTAISSMPDRESAGSSGKTSLEEDAPENQNRAPGSRNKVVIHTDGAARGNPDGPGGYGAVLEFIDSKGGLHTKELSQGYVKTTNNRMELMGAIAALEALTKPCEVELWSDSKYLVSAFNEHWIDNWVRKNWMRSGSEPVKNTDLWKRLLAACAPHTISWNWVKGHDGNAMNERCDFLATAAADSDHLIPDPGV